jgi:outer membrane protein assembly factor BamA
MRFWSSAASSFLMAVAFLACSACSSIPPGHSSVDSISVEGTNEVDEEDVEEKLATVPTPKFLGLFRGVIYDYEVFDRLKLQRDLARVERYYRARGFYEAHARAGRVMKKSDGHVTVEIMVEEGRPTLIGTVELKGLEALPPDMADRAKTRALQLLAKGDRFEEEKFASAENDIKRVLTDRGYARATVKRDAVVDVVHRSADIVLHVDPGPRSTFGKVTVEGLGDLPEGPVRRALDITEGGEYSEAELENARQAVLDLGVFSSVEVIPDLSGAPEQNGPSVIPVHVKLEGAKLHSVKLGGGVEFDAIKADIHGVVGWEARNFLGGMRTYSVTFKPGVVFYPLRVNNWVWPQRLLPEFKLRNEFRQPGFIEARTTAFIRPEFNLFPVLLGKDVHPEDPVLGYLEFKGGAGVDRVIWKLYTSLAYNLQVEKPIWYKGPSNDDLNTLVLAYPELVTIFQFVNDRIRPRKGVSIGNTLQVAGGPFGGVARDVRVQPDVRGYVPLGKRVTLAARTSIGLLFPSNYGRSVMDYNPDRDPPVPGLSDADRTNDLQIVFFRGLFAGGPNSNRGYPLRGIGPHQNVPYESLSGISTSTCNALVSTAPECLVPTGGFTSWEASVEVRISIAGPVSMAVFTDTADVSPQIANLRFSRPHLSSGLGVRYDTPVGPIRLDIGYRIPGLQTIGVTDPLEPQPKPIFDVLPVTLAFGIGEAY